MPISASACCCSAYYQHFQAALHIGLLVFALHGSKAGRAVLQVLEGLQQCVYALLACQQVPLLHLLLLPLNASTSCSCGQLFIVLPA